MAPKSQYYQAYKDFGWSDSDIISKESLDAKLAEKRKYLSPNDIEGLKKLQEQYRLLLEYKEDINEFIINNGSVSKWMICELYGTCKIFVDLLIKNSTVVGDYEKLYKRYSKAFEYLNVNQGVRLLNKVLAVGSAYKHNTLNAEAYMIVVLKFVADECKLLKNTCYDVDLLLKGANGENGFAKDSTGKFNDEQRAVGFMGMYGTFASFQLLFNVKGGADLCYQNSYLIFQYNDLILKKSPKPDELMFQFKRVLSEE